MHSSRMRTGRSLTVCCSLLPGGVPGSGGLVQGGLLLGVCSQGGLLPEGCLLWGVSAPGGVPGPGGSAPGEGGVCSGGAWSRGGVGIPACTEADTPPVDRHTPVKILPWPNFVAAGNYLWPNK